MERENQNIYVQEFKNELIKLNPHIKEDDVKVILNSDSAPKIELNRNIFDSDREGGLKYPKNWHYEYDRGFVYSDAVNYFNVKVERKQLEDLRHPIDVVYELERLNPDKKFGYDPNSHEIISEENINGLNLDSLINRGGQLKDGRLYFPNILVNGEVLEIGLRKEYLIGDAVSDVLSSVRAVRSLMGGEHGNAQESAAVINRDGSSNSAHGQAVGNSIESNQISENFASDDTCFDRLKYAIENYEYRTVGGNDGTEKEVVVFDSNTGEKIIDNKINAEYNAARKWLKLVCNYRHISLLQDDWNNPEIKNQRVKEAFDEEMRNVFSLIMQIRETLRQYYADRPIERVLDIIDKIPDQKNKTMVTDLVEKYIAEKDQNLHKAFVTIQNERHHEEGGHTEENVRVLELNKKPNNY